MPEEDRYKQQARWIGEGLDRIGDGISWAGFWLGVGIVVATYVWKHL